MTLYMPKCLKTKQKYFIKKLNLSYYKPDINYFKKGCHCVPLFPAMNSPTATRFFSITVTKG